jgi:[acyl-carrier-protein] S-malonyltransferase
LSRQWINHPESEACLKCSSSAAKIPKNLFRPLKVLFGCVPLLLSPGAMSKTALIFAGQGAQKAGMGRDLAETIPAARQLFDRANEVLGYDLASICLDGPEEELTKTENAQPGIYLVSWIAFELLKERVPGLQFHATAGLSLGEFTALAAAGAMSFEDGLRIVRQRGRFMQEACDVTQGSMAAIIGLDEADVRSVCDDAGVELANLNCPGQLVISGETEKINQACEAAKAKGAKRALPLTVAGAYHSRLMESARTKLEAELAKVDISTPGVPVISNVTAAAHGEPEQIRATLVAQVTSSVLWEKSMRALIADGFTRFIELGPGNALTGFLKRIDTSVEKLNVADVASLESTVKALTD